MSSREKNKGNTMSLPNIPKMTDDKNRIKYMTDYEKYEPELLKHHIGSPETTTTIGLKNVPAEFDRTVPSPSDLTVAEQEYEKYLALRNARRKKKHFTPHPMKEVTVTKPKPKQSRTGSPASISPTPPPQSASNGVPPSPEPRLSSIGKLSSDLVADAANAAAPPNGMSSAAEGGVGHNNLPPLSAALADAKGDAAGAKVVLHTPTSVSRPGGKRSGSKGSLTGQSGTSDSLLAGNGSRGSVTAGGAGRASSRTDEDRGSGSLLMKPSGGGSSATPASFAGSASPSTALGGASSGRTSGTYSTSPPTSSAFKPAVPKRSDAPRPHASPKRTTMLPPSSADSGSRRSANRSPVSSSNSPKRKSIHVTSSYEAPKPKALTAEEVQKYLAENCPSSPAATKVQPAKLGDEVAECADVLRVLVNPPPEYAASVKVDMRGIDIDWITGKRRRPAQLVTMQNWQSLSNRGPPRISSPRSALVLLRNGISTHDLIPHLPKDDDVLLPQDPVLRAAVKKFRVERDKARRDELAEQLLNDYLSISAQFTQQELIFAVNKPPDVADRHDVNSTSLMERQEKQKRQFEINKIRMARANELAESLHAKRVAAEERRLRAEEEQREALEAKIRAEESARQLQQQRLEEQKRKLAEMERTAMEALKQRQELAEKRNQERMEAQERQFEQRQKIRREKEEERQRRFNHAQAQLQLQALEVQRKQEEVARKLEEIEEAKRLKVEEDQRLLKEKQARVREARREAARRAAEQEERTREAALEKQRQVEERIEKFMMSREEEAQRRAQMEREKQEKRREAFSHAVELQEEFKQKTEEKRRQHDMVYNELTQEKLLSLTMMREREREEMLSKADAIHKLQRVEEFKKLHTVAELIEKRRVAEHLEAQRAEILEKSLAERDKLNAEKQLLRKKLEMVKV